MPILRLLPLILLTGCTGGIEGLGPQACILTKAADIPVTAERGFISAPATIDDKPVTMLIDSGAESSMVTPSAMQSLQLSQDLHRQTTIRGTGGVIHSQNALLQSIGIGGMEELDQSAAVGALPVSQGPAMHASGLLGADWLSDFDVEFDLPHHRIALYRVHGCSGDYVPWRGPKSTTNAQVWGRGLVLLSVSVDGHPVTALLDSGANRSTLGESAAEAAGIDAAAMAADRTGQNIGVDGAVRVSHQHRFALLKVGGAAYADPLIAIGPLHLAMADMLLGADWLRGNRVWVSYATRKVIFQPS